MFETRLSSLIRDKKANGYDCSLEAVKETKTFYENAFGCDFTNEISKGASDEELQNLIDNN